MNAEQRERFFENLPQILAADAKREHVEMVLQPGHPIMGMSDYRSMVESVLEQMGEHQNAGSCSHGCNYSKMTDLGIDFDDPRGHEYTVSFKTETLANRFINVVARIGMRDTTFPFRAQPPE